MTRSIVAISASESLGGAKDPGGEAVLHQRLAARQGEAAAHTLQAGRILPQFIGRAGHRHRHSVGKDPGVRVVTKLAAEHARGRPGDQPEPRPVDGRTGGKRMKESDIAGLQGRADIDLRNGLAEIDPHLVGTCGLEGRLLRNAGFGHISLRGTYG
jgi:hypothetical protein